jgi:hypothetical protein
MKTFPFDIFSIFPCKTTISKIDARGIQACRETYPNKKMAPGVILYTGDYPLKLRDNILALPWN